uniref:Uncharacterized protein n=1 Tax=Timema shepardi TaxID=629360 RepID=A0A7R9B9Q8_TIMSH|nr:unnamed protein product [Timema shepardi]
MNFHTSVTDSAFKTSVKNCLERGTSPGYLSDTLKIDLEYIGYILATPYLMMIFVMQFTGRASDWLVGDNILSQTQVRKVFLCGSYTLNSFLMLLAGLLRDPVAATLCLVVALVVLAVSMAVVW